MSTRRYVYAIARPLDPAGLVGVDGATIELVAHDNLVAVVSVAPFDEATLTARLEHLGELAALAEAHHAVVAALAARTVIAPFRLATIYADEHRVRELLHSRREQFDTLLDRLAGTVELGVKLYVDDRPPAPATPGGSGRAYLRQLSERNRRRDEHRHHAAAVAERVDATLGAHAVDRSHHRPQPAQLSGVAGHNILNAAYLVPTGRIAAFTELAHRLATDEPDVRVEVTGPWAPYSFTGDRP
jgi:hypothetical protein